MYTDTRESENILHLSDNLSNLPALFNQLSVLLSKQKKSKIKRKNPERRSKKDKSTLVPEWKQGSTIDIRA